MTNELRERLLQAAKEQPMHNFIQSLAAQVLRGRILSDKQVAAIQTVLDNLDAEDLRLANVQPLQPGNQRLHGTIQRIKTVDGKYGPTKKMIVLLDSGNKVYCTVPSKLNGDAVQGTKVTFTGQVTVSDSDPHFGFVKHPTLIA